MTDNTFTPKDLKSAREKLGMTQKQFGVALGFTELGAQRTVCGMENGERKIMPATAKLAKMLVKNHKPKKQK